MTGIITAMESCPGWGGKGGKSVIVGKKEGDGPVIALGSVDSDGTFSPQSLFATVKELRKVGFKVDSSHTAALLGLVGNPAV